MSKSASLLHGDWVGSEAVALEATHSSPADSVAGRTVVLSSSPTSPVSAPSGQPLDQITEQLARLCKERLVEHQITKPLKFSVHPPRGAKPKIRVRRHPLHFNVRLDVREVETIRDNPKRLSSAADRIIYQVVRRANYSLIPFAHLRFVYPATGCFLLGCLSIYLGALDHFADNALGFVTVAVSAVAIAGCAGFAIAFSSEDSLFLRTTEEALVKKLLARWGEDKTRIFLATPEYATSRSVFDRIAEDHHQRRARRVSASNAKTIKRIKV